MTDRMKFVPQGFPMDIAPKDGSSVLIVDGDGNFSVVFWNEYMEEDCWTRAETDDSFEPECWWPLPRINS